MFEIKRLRLPLTVLLCGINIQVLGPSNKVFAEPQVLDGFLAYCTSNNDWTGNCVNTENNRTYTCEIEYGQIINCKSLTNKPFQCIWTSNVRANAAEFWCDADVDKMLSREMTSNNSIFSNTLAPTPNNPSESKKSQERPESQDVSVDSKTTTESNPDLFDVEQGSTGGPDEFDEAVTKDPLSSDVFDEVQDSSDIESVRQTRLTEDAPEEDILIPNADSKSPSLQNLEVIIESQLQD